MDRLFFALGSLLGGLGVAIGAFGAHAMRGRITEDLLANYETGVRYHFYHALALFAVVVAIQRWPSSTLPVVAGWLFIVGVIIFSGSLYLMAFTGLRWLGAITPIGGVALIAAWVCLLWVAWRGA
ncbi:MAG: DUF423 domain-containing protein [Caldilineaceae bacterium]|nr:DUF423 domain-containing protein [Caldilineaceae bacterium]MCB0185303.1 DUF423 domain-containing protein [Caldilineaceae bacterium]HRW08452.1 DUF423 domain-containing protein [Caldilineaceae bacterium]